MSPNFLRRYQQHDQTEDLARTVQDCRSGQGIGRGCQPDTQPQAVRQLLVFSFPRLKLYFPRLVRHDTRAFLRRCVVAVTRRWAKPNVASATLWR